MQDPDTRPTVSGNERQTAAQTAKSTMQEVEKYRDLFAEVLVLGSALQGLEGDDQARFEKRVSNGTSSPSTAVSTGQKLGGGGEKGQTMEIATEGAGAVNQNAWGQTVEGLKGLSRMMYRQHAKQLKRAYSVA